MRPSLLAFALLPLLAAALPPTNLAIPSTSSDVTSPFEPPSPQDPAQAAIVTEQEVKQEKPWEESVTTALVVLPCRGCGTAGADEFFVCRRTAPRLLPELTIFSPAIELYRITSGIQPV